MRDFQRDLAEMMPFHSPMGLRRLFELISGIDMHCERT
jgi:hypothetical protein